MTYVVIKHVLDPDANRYQLIVGTEETFTHSGADELGNETTITETVVTPVVDVVFDADDARWLDGGARRPHSDVMVEQQSEVFAALQTRDALASAPADVTPDAVVQLAPAGMPLTSE